MVYKKIMKKASSFVAILLCIVLALPMLSYAAEGEESESTTYKVTVEKAEFGSINLPDDKKISEDSQSQVYEYESGDKVQLTAFPNTGYFLQSVSITTDQEELNTSENENTYSFIMPGSDVTIKAQFEAEPVPTSEDLEDSETDQNSQDQNSEDSEDQEREEQKDTEKNTQETIEEDSSINEEDTNDQEETQLLQPQLLQPQLSPLRSVARATNTITYYGKTTYGGINCGHFEIDGKVAFCMEHQKATPPDGTSFSKSIYDNATIRKILYYGWGGVKQWSGFKSQAQGIVCTSLTLSYFYSGSDSIILLGGPTDATIGVSDFISYINSMPDVGSNKISLSTSNTESYVSDDKTYQRTENIKLTADAQNTITVPLPEGVELVNVTTGNTGTGNVKVKGGDTFYLKAPLNMNGTWNSGKLYGSMGKFQAVMCITSSSGMQNLAQGVYTSDPDSYVSLSVKWVQMGDIRISKFLESSGEIKTPAVGAEFTLTHQETGEVVVITADENGVATTEGDENYPIGRLEGGEWLVEETKTPEGYKTVDPFKVTIYGQGLVFQYVIEDKEIFAPLQVIKLDESTGNVIAASGATFKIVDQDGNDVEFTSYSPNKKIFTEFTTDENGQYTLPEKLKYGKYQLVELKAPEGYLLAGPIDFEIDKYQDWETPVVLKAEDENAMGVIQIIKTDKNDSERKIEGAEYQIYAAEDIVTADGTTRATKGSLIGTVTTDKEGKAESEELFLGKYIVKESKAPEGYVLDDTAHEVELTYKDDKTAVVYEKLEVQDKPTEVVITKRVKDKDVTLEGVKFNIWNKEMMSDVDPEFGLKETYTTDENGQIYLEYLSPGTYCVQETETVPGYVTDDTIYEFVIDENGMYKLTEDDDAAEEGNLVIENDYTKLHISKQDATTGEELPGAELEIIDENGNVIDKWTSTDEVHVIEAIPAGEYTLKETIAPDGYLVANEITFTVEETGEVQQVVMKDELSEGTIKTSMPDNSKDGSSTSGVKTGDTSQIAVLVALAVAMLFIISVMLVYRKKGQKNE